MKPDVDIKLNTKGIDDLIAAFKYVPTIKVGVLGNKDNRTKGSETNASIGLKHEFGLGGMPLRSFLRMPLTEKLGDALENTRAFSRDILLKVIKDKSITEWAKKIALVAETVVQDAFDSGGFGKWPKWKTKGYENNTGMILVDTQQLRNSISSEVK